MECKVAGLGIEVQNATELNIRVPLPLLRAYLVCLSLPLGAGLWQKLEWVYEPAIMWLKI